MAQALTKKEKERLEAEAKGLHNEMKSRVHAFTTCARLLQDTLKSLSVTSSSYTIQQIVNRKERLDTIYEKMVSIADQVGGMGLSEEITLTEE